MLEPFATICLRGFGEKQIMLSIPIHSATKYLLFVEIKLQYSEMKVCIYGHSFIDSQ